ncbi:MAG: FliG C-terminal domain-containing protein [Patescibacteria group bacterium]|nr:FliG C-terminal domain-containing protein [Patescibacteria group bacterium]
MNAIDDGIRKAAVFVAALDCSAADALLERLPDGQARQVRDAMIALSKVDAGEQRRVRDEFLRVRARPSRPEPAGIELDGNLAMLRPAFARGGNPPKDAKPQQESPPFTFLSDAAGGDLVEALRNERPQTIAMVLAHLPPRRASELLQRLAPPVQADVIRRLATLEEMDPSVVFEVEQALKSRVARQWGIQPKRVVGMKAVQGIRDVGDAALERVIARTLEPESGAPQRSPSPQRVRPPAVAPSGAARQPHAANPFNAGHESPAERAMPAEREMPAERAMPESETYAGNETYEEDEASEFDAVEFSALEQLNAASLAAVFHEAGRQLAGTALLGAPAALVNRVLRVLPRIESKSLRRQLDEPGPIRLSDVEEARRRVARIATELARDGRIEPTFHPSRMILTA